MSNTKDIINYKALSEIITGQPRRITKEDTAKRYADDVQQLIDMIDTWVKWNVLKHHKDHRKSKR